MGEGLRPEQEAMRRTRAVRRNIAEGSNFSCEGCDEAVYCLPPRVRTKALRAGRSILAVVCNKYDDTGKWAGTYVYHEDCYIGAGEPYGERLDAPPVEPTPVLDGKLSRHNVTEVFANQLQSLDDYAE